MALNYRQVILAGNLTRDPEQRFTNSGTEVSQFGLAVNETYRNGDGDKQEKAHFYDCVAYGQKAEAINRLFNKGKPIFFIGVPDYSTWEAQDGSTRSKIQMKVLNFEFVPDGKGSQSANGNGNREEVDIREEDYADIPF